MVNLPASYQAITTTYPSLDSFDSIKLKNFRGCNFQSFDLSITSLKEKSLSRVLVVLTARVNFVKEKDIIILVI